MPTIIGKVIMKILLTSFQHSKILTTISRFSVARWQPKGFSYPKLYCFSPRVTGGMDLTTEFSPKDYKTFYDEILEDNRNEIKEFMMEQFELATPILALCCWCNSSRQKDREHLYCHTILIGHYIKKQFPYVEFNYCDGRDKDWFADIFLGEEDNE